MPRVLLHPQNTICLQRNLRKRGLITFYKPNIVQATYTLQFGSHTTEPRLPAATGSNEVHILQNFSPTFASVLSDGSNRTKALWMFTKARHATNSKSAFPTVTQQQFLQLQLLAVATRMIGDLDFLCSTARCTVPSANTNNMHEYIYIYFFVLFLLVILFYTHIYIYIYIHAYCSC